MEAQTRRLTVFFSALHLGASGVHDASHFHVGILGTPLVAAYVVLVIHVAPIAALAWGRGNHPGRARHAAWLLFGALAGSTCFGGYEHFFSHSADDVRHVTGHGAGLFAGTAVALAVVDLLGTLYLAALLLPRTALKPDGGGRHIILVDGECVFCGGLVARILELDRSGLFCFTHLQSELARRARARHGADPDDIDGIYLLVHEGTASERLLIDGAAGREIWPRLLAPAMPMRLVPRPLLDLVYRAFARYRYRLFGKSDTCLVPDASIRSRFLADP